MIEAHRGAFEYDWRARFGKSLRCVGRSMSWGEAIRQTQQLGREPGSHVQAAINGWDYPLPWEAIVVANLYDLVYQAAWAMGGRRGAKPKPHPRPWVGKRTTRRTRTDLSQAEIIAALRAAGHTAPLPTKTSEVTTT